MSTGIWKVYQALKADGWTFAKLGHNMYRTEYNANCDFDYISASKKVDDDKTVVIKVESNSNGYMYGTVAAQENTTSLKLLLIGLAILQVRFLLNTDSNCLMSI